MNAHFCACISGEIENFFAKFALSGYQDYHAGVSIKNIAWIFAFPISDWLAADCVADRKYSYQVNLTRGLTPARNRVLFFQRFKTTANRKLDAVFGATCTKQRTHESRGMSIRKIIG